MAAQDRAAFTVRDATEQFRAAIIAELGHAPEVIEADGRLHRFATNDKRSDGAGWYVLHDEGIPAGAFGCWRSGINETWRADIGRALSPQEAAAHRARVAAMRREREADDSQRKAEARKKAAAIWQTAQPAPNNHPYLLRKGVAAHGLRVHDGALVVPVRDGAELHSVLWITGDGEKRFLPGGRVSGCYFSIGKPKAVLCIAEGFATGASIYEATGLAVAVAFGTSNLLPVAQALRAQYHELRLIVCADDDVKTPGNPGLTKARDAARAVGAHLAVPDFGAERPEGATDFNDLARLRGADAVRAHLDRAAPPAVEAEARPPQARARADDEADAGAWPEPQPLVAAVKPEPYPADALPATIRAAVEEVQGFVKAPVPLVASSALGALSLAAQAHYDARRADKLEGPTSLFLLTIADSGERKSTCDGFFSAAIRDYELRMAEEAKPAVARHVADLGAWEAKRDGIKARIRKDTERGKPTGEHEAALRDLENLKPQPPRVPKLLRVDDTPEKLAFLLAREWPSAGIMSSEAGTVLGAHGMGRDSIMRYLALLNLLWENGTLPVGRRTTESFTVRGARLTVALQVQEATLRSFFDRSQGLARGTGFLARFLAAWPESTQGTRAFTEAPQAWPALAEFNRRIAAILKQPVPIGDDGALTPAVLTLSPEAKAAWIAFHDAIEAELRSGGELYDVRDVASKIADNAARLAALFQVFEHGMGAAVGAECFAGAARIAAWHLNESRRFFGELALPAELADAARLDTWLIGYCGRERTNVAGKNHVRQHGPLRDGARLDTAIRELAALDRLRPEKNGRRLAICLNPALLPWGRP